MALKKSSELAKESVNTLLKFQSGDLTPIKTGREDLDEALLGGFLPSTVLGICARSTHGKTHDLEEIERNILEEEGDNVIFMKCAWEMEHFKLFVRDISEKTGKSVRRVIFEKPETEEEKAKFNEIYNSHKKDNIFYQTEPASDEEFSKDVKELIQSYPEKKIVVSIDNLENALNTKGDQKKSMDALLYTINILKKTHPFIVFIILDQLNGNYLERMHDLKKQRPIDNDIYGTEQLLKLCDVLYIKIIPWKLGIREKFMVFGRNEYNWLSDHKITTSPTSKTASFDPFGRAFYFYLKLRQPDDIRNTKDLHIKVMFERSESDTIETILQEETKITSEPVFENAAPLIDLKQRQFPTFPGPNSLAANTNFDNQDEPF